MCVSLVGQIIFGIIMTISLLLTMVAIFTPGWRSFSDEVRADLKNHTLPETQGLLPFMCRLPEDINNAGGHVNDYCAEWLENVQLWEKAVIACMCAAVLGQVIVLIWNGITFCACGCNSCLIQPLCIISSLVVILLAAAVIVYGVNNKSAFEDSDQWKKVDVESKMTSELGYSFWCAVLALVTSTAAAIVATVTVCFGEKGL